MSSLLVDVDNKLVIGSQTNELRTALSNSENDLISLFYYDKGFSFPISTLGTVVNESLYLPGLARSNSRFPFSRLAWTSSNSSSSVYLYHQLNETMLAEEILIDLGWSTKMIPVPMA